MRIRVPAAASEDRTVQNPPSGALRMEPLVHVLLAHRPQGVREHGWVDVRERRHRPARGPGLGAGGVEGRSLDRRPM
jgi:hypothetical protein